MVSVPTLRTTPRWRGSQRAVRAVTVARCSRDSVRGWPVRAFQTRAVPSNLPAHERRERRVAISEAHEQRGGGEGGRYPGGVVFHIST